MRLQLALKELKMIFITVYKNNLRHASLEKEIENADTRSISSLLRPNEKWWA